VRVPLLLLLSLAALSCAGGGGPAPAPAPAVTRASILVVTLDTTRFDAVGAGAPARTPVFDALVARGLSFRQAYAVAPETLPAHASMWTGLLPAGHGVRENGRPLAAGHALAAQTLRGLGYRTAAFVSSFVLASRFGLAPGFDTYDDTLAPGQNERRAQDTTDAAVTWLQGAGQAPVLLWVHYYDAHAPYAPPEPFKSRHSGTPYHAEVAAVDEQLGRLVAAFERATAGPRALLVLADHGEGLGDHGEALHGNLLYQTTMHVPLVLVAPGAAPGVVEAPVSTRRVFHTVLDLAGAADAWSLRQERAEVVLGEALRPFLSYGWQPQVMAVEGRQKVIRSGGRDEVFDVVADPGETRDLGPQAALSREVRDALLDYPLAPPAGATPAPLGEEDRQRLAALGYVAAGAPPVVRPGAPRPAEMVDIFPLLDTASGLFVRGDHARAAPILQRILARDPENPDAALRLAISRSSLGETAAADAAFERAARLAPGSEDVRLHRTLHEARGPGWTAAVPALEAAAAQEAPRLPALEGLAVVRERQGRIAEAVELRLKVARLRPPGAAELVRLGDLAMSVGRTDVALQAFEQARAQQGIAFRHHLELGALYLAARRYEDARTALDRVPRSHPAWPMALFKRAQLSVLLNEPDRAARIEAARRGADATTRPLLEKERLFK
jgi:choline-sulfatase